MALQNSQKHLLLGFLLGLVLQAALGFQVVLGFLLGLGFLLVREVQAVQAVAGLE